MSHEMSRRDLNPWYWWYVRKLSSFKKLKNHQCWPVCLVQYCKCTPVWTDVGQYCWYVMVQLFQHLATMLVQVSSWNGTKLVMSFHLYDFCINVEHPWYWSYWSRLSTVCTMAYPHTAISISSWLVWYRTIWNMECTSA